MQKALWIVSSIILSILLAGCLFVVLPKNPILRGKVFIEDLEGTIKGHPISHASVQVLDLESGQILANTQSNQEGYYSLSVPAGGPYLIQAQKDSFKLFNLSPVTEENGIYDLDLTGIVSTAATLVFLEIIKENPDPKQANLEFIKNASGFKELLELVQRVVIDGGDPTSDEKILQLAKQLAKILLSSSQNAIETFSPLPPIQNTTQKKYHFSLQEAIDEAQNGDIIVATTGIYRENLNFKGKNITLQSANPDNPQVVAKTIIDGGNRGSVVTFQNGETSKAVLRGFTIQNGTGSTSSKNSNMSRGGGMLISGSSPTIEKNWIQKNSADYGGGIYIENGSPHLLGNTIEENTSTVFGGGICIINASPTLGSSNIASKNIIQNNQSSLGGGIYINKNSTILSDGIPWDRAFYEPFSGWPCPNYITFNTFSTNTHSGGNPGSQVYFEARKVTFATTGSGEINVSGNVVTNQSLFFPVGAKINIEAAPGKEYLFQEWAVSTGTLQDKYQHCTTYIVPQNDATITANFLPLREFTFRVQGLGSIDVSVISRPVAYNDFEGSITTSSEKYQYLQGTILSLKATPSTNYGFLKWVVDDIDYSTDSSITLTVSQNTTIQAIFGLVREITFKINPDDGTNVGSIYVNDMEVLNGKTTTQTVRYYPEGKNIIVEARNLAGDFQSWNTGSSSPYLFYEVAGDTTITANFTTPPIKNITQAVYFRTISNATSSAQASDTVEVRPGTYYENGITLLEKVTLKSTGGRDVTIIDGNNASPGITLQDGTTIDGFTIQNFSSSAIYVIGSNCTIQNNKILNNQAEKGGGILVSSEANNCAIMANIIESNHAIGDGGGIYVSGCNGTSIHSNTIQYNQAGNKGGGIYIDTNASYYDNTVYKNTASSCPNIYTTYGLCE